MFRTLSGYTDGSSKAASVEISTLRQQGDNWKLKNKATKKREGEKCPQKRKKEEKRKRIGRQFFPDKVVVIFTFFAASTSLGKQKLGAKKFRRR